MDFFSLSCSNLYFTLGSIFFHIHTVITCSIVLEIRILRRKIFLCFANDYVELLGTPEIEMTKIYQNKIYWQNRIKILISQLKRERLFLRGYQEKNSMHVGCCEDSSL